MYIDVIYGQDAGSCQAQTRWGGDGDHSFRHSSCLGSGAALLSISSVVENSVKPLLTPDKWTNAKYAEVISWHILHILHMIICKICRIWTVHYLFAYLFAYCSIFILHILHILHIAICKICRIWTVHYYFAYYFAYQAYLSAYFCTYSACSACCNMQNMQNTDSALYFYILFCILLHIYANQ